MVDICIQMAVTIATVLNQNIVIVMESKLLTC